MNAETQKIDIHDKKGKYETQLTNFRKRKDILAENKQQITGYLEYILSNGRSADRAIKYLTHLTMMACFFKKPFKEVEEADIRKFLANSESRSLSPETIRDYKTALKVFFRWLYNTKEDPALVNWFNTTLKNGKHRLPEEMLTEDEIVKLIEAASHPRDKAFIATLWESGARVGEIGSLKIKHLAFEAIGARIMVDGKTGMRRQRLITSVPYLSQWKNLHPKKDNPEAPLFTQIGNGCQGKPLTYQAIRIMLQKVAEKAGIKKRVNPHTFRHSRATHLANHLTEAQMKEYLGWVQGSKQAGVYVHLSGKNVDSAILKMYGMQTEKEAKEENKLKPKQCQVCDHTNEATAERCNKCGTALTLEGAISIDKREEIRRKDEEAVLLALQQNMNTIFEKLYELEKKIN